MGVVKKYQTSDTQGPIIKDVFYEWKEGGEDPSKLKIRFTKYVISFGGNGSKGVQKIGIK